MHNLYANIIAIMSHKKSKSSHQLLTYIMFVVAFAAPLSNFPQIYTLFSKRVTEGLSLETWIMYVVFAFVQLFYAVTNKIKPLIVSNLLWIVVELVMIYGIVSFRMADAPLAYDRLLMINNIGKSIGGLAMICFSSAAALFAYDLMGVSNKNRRVGQKT